jgi:hypothetical protein
MNKESGKWFWRVGYYVLPRKVRVSIPSRRQEEIRAARQEVDASRREHKSYRLDAELPVATLNKEEAKALSDSIVTSLKAAHKLQSAVYRAQPTWKLSDVRAFSRQDLKAIVEEFLEFATVASGEYGWMSNDPPDTASWELHGWKHICHNDLIALSNEAQRSWVPEIRMIAAVGGKNIENLFARAIAQEAEAIAAINFLLPSQEERISVARSFCSQGVSDADIRRIPPVLDLGMDLLRIILRAPASPGADLARKQLQRLISRKSLTQGLRGRGRPREPYDPDIVRLTYVAANVLFRQARQVDELLRTQITDDSERASIITRHYPWIKRLSPYVPGEKPRHFLDLSPSAAAIQMLANLLDISSSTIEKLVHRKRRR